MAKRHNQRCSSCKSMIFELLEAIYGKVEKEYNLRLPSKLDGYLCTSGYDDLAKIYSNLQNYRGYKDFIRKKTLSNVDFFVHSPKMIVEFDESQHFTIPKQIW
ncbi:MAG: hypothetical protein HQK91_14805 [Nitrospirae bacterium]|nr:hypothetical protein [Nitrospirota bacterium]MBF0542708.1 hypothetical protein [Nitrospirota bacterium]